MIGLGGVGSFSLSALSKKTSRVLGIERFVRGHDRGSSHGGSRIYRRAYFEHPNYVPWIEYSLAEFQRLQESQNVRLLQECGTLIMEEAGGPVIQASLDSAVEHGIEVEKLSTSQLKERFPQFQCDENMVGLLEPGGGFIRPEKTIYAALADAESRGATVWEETAVCSIREIQVGDNETHVEVTVERNGAKEVITAKSVVVAAGSWSSELVPLWREKLTVTRQVQAWIDISSTENPSLYEPSNMPTWYMSSPKYPLPLYGIPADPESENPFWIKMGVHHRKVQVDPNDAKPDLNDEEWTEVREAGRHAIRHADELSWPKAKSCLYTVTPDENYMVGQPAGSNRIYVATGLSGHGFKMTPALGQMLADWALQQDTSHWKAEFVSPSRFGL